MVCITENGLEIKVSELAILLNVSRGVIKEFMNQMGFGVGRAHTELEDSVCVTYREYLTVNAYGDARSVLRELGAIE